jgi:hypothetical protein
MAGNEGIGSGVAASGLGEVEAEGSGVGGGVVGADVGVDGLVADPPTHAARANRASSSAAAAAGRDIVPIMGRPSCTGAGLLVDRVDSFDSRPA